MKLRWLLLLLLPLGCYTPQTLAQKAPQLEFDTSKPPKTVATIISTGWAEHRSSISTIIRGDGFTLSLVTWDDNTDATVQIDPNGTGSHVKYWARWPALSPKWMSDPIKACQE